MDWHTAIDKRIGLARYLGTAEGWEYALRALTGAGLLRAGFKEGRVDPRLSPSDLESLDLLSEGVLMTTSMVLNDPQAPTYAIREEFSLLWEHAAERLPSYVLAAEDFDYPASRNGVAFVLPPWSPVPGKMPLHGFVWWVENERGMVAWLTDPFLPGERPPGGPEVWLTGIDPFILGKHVDVDSTDRLMNLFPTFLALVDDRVVRRSVERPPRSFARRARARSLPELVTVLTLRRTMDPTTGMEQDLEPGSVEWSHRWIVSGHWVNQWYPSSQRHKPLWRNPYIKGPLDKPLIIKQQMRDARQ